MNNQVTLQDAAKIIDRLGRYFPMLVRNGSEVVNDWYPFIAQFPLDVLKIDQSFVQKLDVQDDNRVIVSATWKGEGDIYNAEFLDALRKLTDEVFFTPGINRAGVRSLFTPNVRYIEVTEFGFNGDVVIPSRFVAAMSRARNVCSALRNIATGKA